MSHYSDSYNIDKMPSIGRNAVNQVALFMDFLNNEVKEERPSRIVGILDYYLNIENGDVQKDQPPFIVLREWKEQPVLKTTYSAIQEKEFSYWNGSEGKHIDLTKAEKKWLMKQMGISFASIDPFYKQKTGRHHFCLQYFGPKNQYTVRVSVCQIVSIEKSAGSSKVTLDQSQELKVCLQ